MAQLFTIEDSTVVITNATLSTVQGNINHTGTLSVNGDVTLANDLQVAGTITADTINVTNLVTESGNPVDIGNWITTTETDLAGKGLSWSWGEGQVQLAYRSGGRLWSNANIDLASNSSYKIDNIEVLNSTSLGPQISSSNLTQLGTLESLNVSGEVELSQFAYFNSTLGRLGLNNEEPNGVLSVTENNVEFIIAAPNYGVATVGTYTNSDVSFISDNTPRFTLKSNGDVIFGNQISNSANVTIYGNLNVTTITADTRINRYSPLQFSPSSDTSIYGLGLSWVDPVRPRQLVLMPEDKLFTTESFEIAPDQSYYIGSQAVLSATALGPSVINSSLTTVGPLTSLSVQGSATFGGSINAIDGLNANIVTLIDDTNPTTLSNTQLNAKSNFSIAISSDQVFSADATKISIGNNINNTRNVTVYGNLSVGISNPDPSVSLAVSGNISFANKKFITGITPPAQGSFSVGDICWNQTPRPGSYIGWVCIVEGGPGQWAPFGSIAQQ
jgi:hypothetical protein